MVVNIKLLTLFVIVSLVAVSAFAMSSRLKSQAEAMATASASMKNCPSGYIPFHGFCVMKYDAKCTNTDPKCVTAEGVYKNNQPGCECRGKFTIVSKADGAPITYIPEDDGSADSAKAYCKNIGAHLMTNPEWMTIANDVSQIPENWCNPDGTGCGNPPGSPGKILANGHNDSVPAKALESGKDDEPCFGTVAVGPGSCGDKSSQKRTLAFSNGEVIWDFAGQVWQWVDAGISRKDEPRTIIPGEGNLRWTWGEFQTVPRSDLFSPPVPKWNSAQGVGRIYHFNSIGDTDTTIYTFIRGGNWRHGADSGAFTIHMQPVPGKTNIDDVGFRCVTEPI